MLIYIFIVLFWSGPITIVIKAWPKDSSRIASIPRYAYRLRNQKSFIIIIVVIIIIANTSGLCWKSLPGSPRGFFRMLHVPESLGGKIFLLWNMYVVFSRKKCGTAAELLSMICLLWKMHVLLRNAAELSFSSIREKSKQESWQRNNSSSLRCVWFPKASMTLNKVEGSSLTLVASSNMELL